MMNGAPDHIWAMVYASAGTTEKPTTELRFMCGRLQQAWRDMNSGALTWRDVPDATPAQPREEPRA